MPFSIRCVRSKFSLLLVLISICLHDATAFTTTLSLAQHHHHHGQRSSRTRTISLHSTTSKQQGSSSSGSSNNRAVPNKDKPTNGSTKQGERSLYDILGTAPTASLDELKSQYKALARLQHPDVVGPGNGDGFIEIAAAYQILKDPVKRRQYDRSLRAASLTNSITQYINETSIVPNAVSMLEDIALPLLRKTTATTLAGMQAATAKTSSKNSGGGGKGSNGGGGGAWWQRVFQAATTASRSMDVMELREKAAVLEEEAVREYEAAVALQQTIQDVVKQRLHFAVATPGVIITSDEAKLLNETVDVRPLQLVEADWQLVLTEDEAVNSALRTVTQSRIAAESAVLRAEQRKIEAQQAYERAIVDARNKTMMLESVVAAEDTAKAAAKKSNAAVERQRQVVTEQSERLRSVLLQIVRPTVPANATAVAELRVTETELSSAASKMELQAAQLLSRSNQMKKRAVVLERMNSQAAGASSPSSSQQQKR
jgi:curved DNA-binding protein CbpA